MSPDDVKIAPQTSISAWTVNQLYWKHRAAFDKLLANGERFRQAQVSRLAGKGTDIHKLLNERREELSAMSRLAAEILQRSSGAAPSGVMRRITATLEALSAYGTLPGAPRAGRLVEDVDPPGFDALAALVPRVGDGSRAVAPSKVLTFQKEAKAPKGKSKSVEMRRSGAEEEASSSKAARDAKQEATRELASAKRVALQAQSALKKAAATPRKPKRRWSKPKRALQKVAEIAHEARQKARRAAVEAESAAQAVDEAERALERATTRALRTELEGSPTLVRSHSHLAHPSRRPTDLQTELVEHPGDGVVDDVVDRAGMVVEGRQRRHDDAPMRASFSMFSR